MKKKHNLPNRLVKGKSGQAGFEAPTLGGHGGRVETNLKDIHWTPAKLGIVSTVLLAPFTFAIVVSFQAGNSLIGIVLIGLGLFVGLIYLALRFIENNDF